MPQKKAASWESESSQGHLGVDGQIHAFPRGWGREFLGISVCMSPGTCLVVESSQDTLACLGASMAISEVVEVESSQAIPAVCAFHAAQCISMDFHMHAVES